MDKKGIRWKQKKGGGMDVFEISPKDVFFKDFEHSRKKNPFYRWTGWFYNEEERERPK